jgi:hypothetical protein
MARSRATQPGPHRVRPGPGAGRQEPGTHLARAFSGFTRSIFDFFSLTRVRARETKKSPRFLREFDRRSIGASGSPTSALFVVTSSRRKCDVATYRMARA